MPSIVIEIYEYERADLVQAVENHQGTLEQQGTTGGSKESRLGPELMLSFKISAPTDEQINEITTAFQMSRDANSSG